MIRLIVKNLITGSVRAYEFERMYDFDQLVSDFGPQIHAITESYHSLRPALDAVVKYLSNNHLQVEIVDPEDREEIYDPNIELTPKIKHDPKNAADLKDILEQNERIDFIDVPEMHTLNSATHRWDK